MRCRSVLPLRRPLCRAGAPSQIWQQGGLRPHTRAIPQRDYGGGTHPDPPVPGATAPQRVHTAVECRHPCQDSTCAPRPVPMSSCSAVTGTTRRSWTTTACGSKSNLTSGMPNSTGGWKTSCRSHQQGHQCGEPLVVHGQCGVPSPGGRAAACPGLQCSGLESRLSRPQIRGRDDKNASGKAEPVLLEQSRNKVACLGRIHPAQPSSRFS